MLRKAAVTNCTIQGKYVKLRDIFKYSEAFDCKIYAVDNKGRFLISKYSSYTYMCIPPRYLASHQKG